jgi:MoxR-like ATPase
MSVDFKTFISLAPHVSKAGLPVILRGRHGVGKSQVVYQIAKNMGLPVIERRASQMTEGDLVGLPSIDGDRTSFNPPDWFKSACEEPAVLFLDEVDRAVQEVRQGIFELTDSRKLNGHHLHPDTVVFAAVNGGEHGEQYQVNEMDPAELDRYSVWDIEPTVEDWLSWAKKNVDGLIWDFINQNHSHLEHNGEYEPNKVYPSRRSWDRLNHGGSASGW